MPKAKSIGLSEEMWEKLSRLKQRDGHAIDSHEKVISRLIDIITQFDKAFLSLKDDEEYQMAFKRASIGFKDGIDILTMQMYIELVKGGY